MRIIVLSIVVFMTIQSVFATDNSGVNRCNNDITDEIVDVNTGYDAFLPGNSRPFMNVSLGYTHSLLHGHGILADVALDYTPRKWVELFGGVNVNTWNIYTASVRGDFRWWLSDSENLAIRNQYLYNCFVDDNLQRFNISLALAYDQEYFYIAAGSYIHFFTPIYSSSSKRSFVWEPGFVYDVRTRLFKKSHVWNLGIQITNILPFIVERFYAPIFVLNANYRLLGEGVNNFNLFAQLACQPSGIFHISANYYSFYIKIGLSCVI